MDEWIFEESYIDSEVSIVAIWLSLYSILINTQHCVCVATSDHCYTRPTKTFNVVQFDEIVRVLEPLHSVDYDDWDIFINKWLSDNLWYDNHNYCFITQIQNI